MAIPTLTKTWHFQVNQLVSAQATGLATAQKLFRQVKDALLGGGSWTDRTGAAATPTNNWTVSGSSNSSTSGMDGVDRWTSDSSVVWGTTSKSWIVLRQSALAAKYEILFYLDSNPSNSGQAHAYFSPVAGFGAANGGTDGSTTTRPTATDEIDLEGAGNPIGWGGVDSNFGNVSSRFHILKSSDGLNTRVFFTRNGVAANFWLLERAANVVTGWTNPNFAFVKGTSAVTGTSYVVMSNLCALNAAGAKGNSSMRLVFTGEAVRPSTSILAERLNQANDLSGGFPMYNIGLYSPTASNRGRHGTIDDMYWGLTSLAEATTYPNDGTRLFCQFGHTVQPWNGTVPNFT